jgi:hypothetical protein
MNHLKEYYKERYKKSVIKKDFLNLRGKQNMKR